MSREKLLELFCSSLNKETMLSSSDKTTAGILGCKQLWVDVVPESRIMCWCTATQLFTQHCLAPSPLCL